MNPLSPFTYYRRHKRSALLLLVLIGSLTLGIFVMVGTSITTVANLLYPYHYLTRMSRILAGQALGADNVAQIRTRPDVVAILPENGLSIEYPTGPVLGSAPLLGVTEDDLELVMEICDLRLEEGRLIEPRAAEIVLSEKIARALDLHIGDHVGHDIDEDLYPAITTELMLVGILESAPSEAGAEVDLGFVSYEYLEGHEKYQPRSSNLLIIPRQGHRATVNDFATALVDGSSSTVSVRLQTFEREIVNYRQTEKVTMGINILAGGIVALSAALVVGMTNQIAIAQRLPELGLLHAAGHAKRRLVQRLLFEILTITGIGWGCGLVISVIGSILLNATPLAAADPVVDLASPVPFLFTLPIPLARLCTKVAKNKDGMISFGFLRQKSKKAHHATGNYEPDGALCASISTTNMGQSAGNVDRSHSGSWEADSERDIAGSWQKPGSKLRQISPCAEPGAVVEQGFERATAAAGGGHVWRQPGGAGDGRAH